MNLEIQRVGPDSIEELHNILEKCGQHMRLRFGLTHWVPAYPLHLMRRDAELGAVNRPLRAIHSAFATGSRLMACLLIEEGG